MIWILWGARSLGPRAPADQSLGPLTSWLWCGGVAFSFCSLEACCLGDPRTHQMTRGEATWGWGCCTKRRQKNREDEDWSLTVLCIPTRPGPAVWEMKPFILQTSMLLLLLFQSKNILTVDSWETKWDHYTCTINSIYQVLKRCSWASFLLLWISYLPHWFSPLLSVTQISIDIPGLKITENMKNLLWLLSF